MESTRRTPNVPAPLAWGLLWLSLFVTWVCLQLIMVAAIHMPPRHSHYAPSHALPPRPPDLSLPLLLAAVMASAMTWQAWHSHRNGEGTAARPKQTAGPATKDHTGLVLVVVFGGMIEIMWAFGLPGTRVNWPLLAALNGGLVVGGLGLTWAERLLSVVPRPGVNPLMPLSAPKPIANARSESPAAPVYGKGREWRMPEALVGLLAFLCLFAMVSLAFTPGMSSFMRPPLQSNDLLFFGGMGAVLALVMTAGVLQNRKEARGRYALTQDTEALQKTTKETSSAFVTLATIGLICAFGTLGLHQNWLLLVGCGVGMSAACLLLKWVMTRPPAS